MEPRFLISKFDINGKTIFTKVDWIEDKNDLFHITVFDGETTWSGRYSNESAEKNRKRVLQTKEEYNKNVKSALSRNTTNYEYGFARHEGDSISARFTWRKRSEGPTGVIMHGSVSVHQDSINNPKKEHLLELLLQEHMDLKQTAEMYGLSNKLLKTELQNSKNELKKFFNVKSSVELSLYNKLLTMLNYKKIRIGFVEKNLMK